MEEKKTAHRDIKPENIFVAENGTKLLIGDFGSSKAKISKMSETIAGTPMYLSPEVRKGYFKMIQGDSQSDFNHDPFKSDVYSLGLTFLYMASLKDCSDLLVLNNLEQKTHFRIAELSNYPTLQKYLKVMLEFDYKTR